MARGDGIHLTSTRNARMKDADIGNAQAHNEREKSSYVNQDIVPERTQYNVHFKTPTAGYKEMFEQMRSDGAISTRGLKADAEKFGELIFDVNSAYFYNHGGYEFAKQFYSDAYKAAIKIVGGEQYILSAVMHATSATAPCPMHWGRTRTTTTFMWSTSLSWRSKSCGRSAARMRRFAARSRKQYSGSA